PFNQNPVALGVGSIPVNLDLHQDHPVGGRQVARQVDRTLHHRPDAAPALALARGHDSFQETQLPGLSPSTDRIPVAVHPLPRPPESLPSTPMHPPLGVGPLAPPGWAATGGEAREEIGSAEDPPPPGARGPRRPDGGPAPAPAAAPRSAPRGASTAPPATPA